MQTFKGRTAVLALRLVACLPFTLNRWLATLIGALIATLPTTALRNSRINLALCYPELSARQHKRLARQSLVESIRNTHPPTVVLAA